MKGTQSRKKKLTRYAVGDTAKSTSDNPLYEGTSDFRPAFKMKRKKRKKEFVQRKKKRRARYGHRR